MNIRGRQTKKCPRCQNRCLISDAQCDDCGLIFARLDEATNKMARKRFKNKEKDQVVYVNKCPYDKKRWKLILITCLAGLFGGHYFYVGRWKVGLSMLASFLTVLICGVILNYYFVGLWNGAFMSIFGVLVGVYAFAWLNDIRRVIFCTFKIPVSLMTKEEKLEEEEMQKLKEEILQKREENSKEEVKK